MEHLEQIVPIRFWNAPLVWVFGRRDYVDGILQGYSFNGKFYIENYKGFMKLMMSDKESSGK